MDTSDVSTNNAEGGAEPTVQSRMLPAGISAAEIAGHFTAGRIRLNGTPVVDLDQPARMALRSRSA